MVTLQRYVNYFATKKEINQKIILVGKGLSKWENVRIFTENAQKCAHFHGNARIFTENAQNQVF